MASTMKALVSAEGQTATVQSVPIPQPGEGEMQVKVQYVAQNPTDWKAMGFVPPGRTIGCDFAGVVSDANGSHWRDGQRVAGFVQGTASDPPRGAFAEFLVIEASLVYAIPDEVPAQQAAVVPLAFATAVQALFGRLKLPEPSKPAKTAFPFLVNGGTSSVGKYAVQLGKMAGAFVIATGSARHHELLKSLGADAVVDYHEADWPQQVRKLSHDGLEHAFDCIAEKGTPETVAKAMSPTKGGHVVALLPLGDVRDRVENKKVRLESTIVYTVFERPLPFPGVDNCGGPTPHDKAQWEKYLALLPDMLTSGKLKPNRFREMGGIDDILNGFEEQKNGRVSAEKLVYRISS
ncbi:zinc-binding dehydrogenase [Xylariomycetidae sp. FL0641]|nr:zinc-binding dehydrogenase [Xylariomycetidae sp. FL0641]